MVLKTEWAGRSGLLFSLSQRGCTRLVLPDGLLHLPRVSLSDGSLFLGVPVGGENFIQHFCAETLSKLDNMLNKSSRLHSGLGKFLILRACFSACRVNHLCGRWFSRMVVTLPLQPPLSSAALSMTCCKAPLTNSSHWPALPQAVAGSA